jgi:hypothetical protein
MFSFFLYLFLYLPTCFSLHLFGFISYLFFFVYHFLPVETHVEESYAERQQSCAFSFTIQPYVSIIKLIWDSPTLQKGSGVPCSIKQAIMSKGASRGLSQHSVTRSVPAQPVRSLIKRTIPGSRMLSGVVPRFYRRNRSCVILSTDSRGHSGTVSTDTTWRVPTSTSDFRVKIRLRVHFYIHTECTKLGERAGSYATRKRAVFARRKIAFLLLQYTESARSHRTPRQYEPQTQFKLTQHST